MLKGKIEIDGSTKEYLIERKNTKTIKYKVYPDLSIKVIVPEKITIDEIQRRLSKRKSWIKKQIEFYSLYQEKLNHELKSGSTIYYLGKQYRLKIINSTEEDVKLIGKYLIVCAGNKDAIRLRVLVDKWYKEHAEVHFQKIITRCLSKLHKYGIKHPKMIIRKMKSRWGSCIQKKNKIIINSNLIKESTLCIEYVIMHELCHLKYPNHNIKFYTFISIVMPDWRYRKGKLEKLRL